MSGAAGMMPGAEGTEQCRGVERCRDQLGDRAVPAGPANAVDAAPPGGRIRDRCQSLLFLGVATGTQAVAVGETGRPTLGTGDRKSTRLNSSHVAISYAVFCLKKKKNYKTNTDK